MKIEVGVAYHCVTEELANKFLKIAEEQGYKWWSGDKPTSFNYWADKNSIYYMVDEEFKCLFWCYENDLSEGDCLKTIEFTDELCDDAQDTMKIMENNTVYIPVKKMNKLLFVEDGSVDVYGIEEKLAEMGIKVIVYRQGANKPELVDLGE